MNIITRMAAVPATILLRNTVVYSFAESMVKERSSYLIGGMSSPFNFNLWIDYPQTVTAGIFALSILGTGGAGMAVFAGFCLLPIAFKATVMYTSRGSILSRTAENLDALTRIAAKIVNIYSGYILFMASPLILSKTLIAAGNFFLLKNLIQDLSHLAMFGSRLELSHW